MPSCVPHWIGNQAATGQTGSLPVSNPATGEVIRHTPIADAATIEHAIHSAQQAFTGWANIPATQRSQVLFRFKALLEQHRDAMAHCIAEEHGKTLSDADGEISRGIEVVEFACGIPHLLKGEYSCQIGQGIDSWSQHTPLGVVVGITPFNFPCMVPLWMIPVAIACGNTFILKPSEKTPSAANMLAHLFKEAGLPEGVLNVVHGGADTANTLIDDARVQAVSFVGSTAVAEQVYARASAHGKRAQALGSAKNHLVVMPDADIDAACDAVMGAAFGSAGERCMAISVVVAIGDHTPDAMAAALAKRIRALRIAAADTDPDMGPLISESHREKVIDLIGSGVEQGASLLVDGRETLARTPGFFLGGSLFDHVTPDMRIYQQEIFGPVACLVRQQTLDAAIELINRHAYGNGASIFTASGHAARQFSHQVMAGMVGVNIPIPVPMAFHCFGGWKRSLFGPLHMHGPDGVRFFTRMKTITSRWHRAPNQPPSFDMPVVE